MHQGQLRLTATNPSLNHTNSFYTVKVVWQYVEYTNTYIYTYIYMYIY